MKVFLYVIDAAHIEQIVLPKLLKRLIKRNRPSAKKVVDLKKFVNF